MDASPDQIIVRLAGVPCGKGRPRFVRQTGRVYTPAKTRSYEDALRSAAETEMVGRARLTGPVRVDVIACFPVPASWPRKKRADALSGALRPTTKPDADNLLKVLDAFDAVVWDDDKQVVFASVEKVYGPDPSFRALIQEMV